ncbi:hypothetical protein B5P43_08100 [Bacillus sp. SRB_336]|nr:hypothetical protein B5P43_08100 [Bacillus sp. SRB_336]
METSQEVAATYSLSYSERLRAAWEISLASPPALLSLSIFPVMGIVLAWTLSLPVSDNTFWDYLIAAACFGFVPCMFLWNAYRSHRANRAKGPYLYRFDSAGVHVSTPTSQLTQLWPAILRVRERRGILFLYFSKRCAHCVPLRALPAPEASAMIYQFAVAGGVPRIGS